MGLVITTQPTGVPVTLDEAKAQCRVLEDDTHDALLARLVQSAADCVEAMTGVALTSRSVSYRLDEFPSGELCIPVYPVTAITSFTYYDVDNAQQTLVSGTDYWPSFDGERYPRVLPETSWPVAHLTRPGAVSLNMTAGYASRDDIPEDLRHAVLVLVKELFDYGGESVTGTVYSRVENTVARLTDNYRMSMA